METALALLRENMLLDDWSDRRITPGTRQFRKEIKKNLDESDIVIFLVSPDFLDSEECREEWRRALSNTGKKEKTLIPIIIKTCAWSDFDNMSSSLVLPRDGRPVDHWDNKDDAWDEIYQQIKTIIQKIRNTFKIKEEYREEISKVEFISQNKETITIDDLFVFPNLIHSGEKLDTTLKTMDTLINNKYTLITGEQQSGKTTLCRKLLIDLVAQGQPAILIDLENDGVTNPSLNFFQNQYAKQFSGEYNLWEKQENKTIIFDNLKPTRIKFVEYAMEHYEKVFIAASSDNYLAYFKDERRLAGFKQIRISSLNRTQQEKLIRKWKLLDDDVKADKEQITDVAIDRIERNINSIIINNKIVPRYPFFVLSIMQTSEAYMPQNFEITAYGHCYYALVVAQLHKLNVAADDIDSCLNFLSHLAHVIFQSSGGKKCISESDFVQFKESYGKQYIMSDATINRLFLRNAPLLSCKNEEISFYWSYSYYYFLGYYLSRNYESNKDTVNRMVEYSYLKDNSLSLTFVIHHSNDLTLIDDILLHTMCAIDRQQPAKLTIEETKVFDALLKNLPEVILSENSINENRRRQREQMDEMDALDEESIEDSDESPHDVVNDVYKTLKNMEILGQIVKNKHGSIDTTKLYEMIEIILDSSLRLCGLFLLYDDEINELAKFIKDKLDREGKMTNLREKEKITHILNHLRLLIFAMVVFSVEKAVASINKREISSIVDHLCTTKNTPAYDLIQSFYHIDTTKSFSGKHRDMIKSMLKKHKNNALSRRLLSFKIQNYFNTHKEVRGPIKQSTLALLDIKPRSGNSGSYNSPSF